MDYNQPRHCPAITQTVGCIHPHGGHIVRQKNTSGLPRPLENIRVSQFGHAKVTNTDNIEGRIAPDQSANNTIIKVRIRGQP